MHVRDHRRRSRSTARRHGVASSRAFASAFAAAWLVLLPPGANAADETPLPTAWAERFRQAPFEASFADDRWLGERASYAIPAGEVVLFDALLNLVNRHTIGNEYESTYDSIVRNLHSSWTVDQDPFSTNQLGHPYQGSMHYGFARSAGLSFWESTGYALAGSALWEIAGETTPPSINDLLNTGIGGSFMGESLFRLASLLLENDDVPPLWREVGAALIQPSLGVNRLAFGERFDRVFASRNPALYSRVNLGFMATAENTSGTSTTSLRRNEAQAEYAIDYGLPGKPGYGYRRPFDLFSFQATASSANGFENMMTRGLLVGRAYDAGPDVAGVWGLYGSFDYIAPQVYRVSSTALSVGTTGQWWVSPSVAMQGTALIGAGYTAVGTTHSTSDVDYNYGVAPQALLAWRTILGDGVALDVTGRAYFVSRVASVPDRGRDIIGRIDAGLTWRVYKRHGITVKYLGNLRDANYDGVDQSQSRNTIGLFYTYLGKDGLGAVPRPQ
ncbi:MAG TPA: DUF3943 domain-containing protein [Casimicrobiaceae bacterium]|nr:DUF3943 domain-containing protein [Casimicrobiaceae bacterium]